MMPVTAMTAIVAGAMHSVMRVSFQFVANATMKPVTKADRPWKVKPSFSEMPPWIRRPFVVACVDIEPPVPRSKKAIS